MIQDLVRSYNLEICESRQNGTIAFREPKVDAALNAMLAEATGESLE